MDAFDFFRQIAEIRWAYGLDKTSHKHYEGQHEQSRHGWRYGKGQGNAAWGGVKLSGLYANQKRFRAEIASPRNSERTKAEYRRRLDGLNREIQARTRAGARSMKKKPLGERDEYRRRAAMAPLVRGKNPPPPGKPVPPAKPAPVVAKPPALPLKPRPKPKFTDAGTKKPVAKPVVAKPAPKPVEKPKPVPKPVEKPKILPKPAVLSGPKGQPVGAALELQINNSKRVRDGVAEVVNAINSVHGDGDLPKLPVVGNATRNANGQYVSSMFGKSVRINVSRSAKNPMITAAHEIGHFLDHKGMAGKEIVSEKNWFVSDNRHGNPKVGPAVDKLWRAMEKSEALRLLQEAGRGKAIPFIGRGGVEHDITLPANLIRYYLKPRELFARAYSQYIATKSGNKNMLKELASVLPAKGKLNGNALWHPDDFNEIFDAMDDLIKEMGWR